MTHHTYHTHTSADIARAVRLRVDPRDYSHAELYLMEKLHDKAARNDRVFAAALMIGVIALAAISVWGAMR